MFDIKLTLDLSLLKPLYWVDNQCWISFKSSL